MEISTIGLDLAKSIFQVHGINAAGEVAVRKALRRSQLLPFFTKLPPCRVGVEACGTSHYWARELTRLGHDVRLMPPAYVKPYVKRGKTDANDAEAVCEAVTRPTMRFVPLKSPEQQAALALHRTRDLLVKQRTQLVNMIEASSPSLGSRSHEGCTMRSSWRSGWSTAVHRTCRSWPSGWSPVLRSRSAAFRRSWQHSRRNCSPGIARTSCHSGWRRSPASESSPRLRSQPR